jgi:hypothetical protein
MRSVTLNALLDVFPNLGGPTPVSSRASVQTAPQQAVPHLLLGSALPDNNASAIANSRWRALHKVVTRFALHSKGRVRLCQHGE